VALEAADAGSTMIGMWAPSESIMYRSRGVSATGAVSTTGCARIGENGTYKMEEATQEQ